MTDRLREAVRAYLENPWGEEFADLAEAYAMTEPAEGVTRMTRLVQWALDLAHVLMWRMRLGALVF